MSYKQPMFDPRQPVDPRKKPVFYTGLGGDIIRGEMMQIRLQYVAAFAIWLLSVALLNHPSTSGLHHFMAWAGAYLWVVGGLVAFYLPGKDVEISETTYLFGVAYAFAGVALRGLFFLAAMADQDGAGDMMRHVSNISRWVMILVPIYYTVYIVQVFGLFRSAHRRVEDQIADQMRQMH